MFKHQLGIIGAGKMGQALLEGLLTKHIYARDQVLACTRQEQSARQLGQRLQIATCNDPHRVVQECETLLIALKPHMAAKVLEQVRDHITPRHTLISVMTGVPTGFLEALTPHPIPVYRAMPNTPAMIGEGMSVLCKGQHTTAAQDAVVEQMFRAVGSAAWIEEDMMNPSTGFSGAGPAFVYVFIEAMSDAGVKLGLSRDLATLMAAQTVKGAAAMVLETGLHPAQLKDRVTTPAGVTIDGLMELEDRGLRVAIIKSIVKAAERADELF
jgi:pyrroline-5-carboxylate reductase